MAAYVHRGIKYVSDSNGYFRHKGYNYLRYNPKDNNVTTTDTKILLTKNVKYYVNSWTTTEVQLSTSHQPNADVVGKIPVETFANGIDMPEAKIKFHPNGGEASHKVHNGVEAIINPLDRCSNFTNWFSTTNPWDIASLFARTGYSGSNWILKHPTDTSKQLTIVQNPENSSEYFSTILAQSNNSTYIITYPQTHYYLYANWTPVSNGLKIYYYNSNGTPVMNNGSHLTTSFTTNTLHRKWISTVFPSESAPSGKDYFLGWDTDRNATNPKYQGNSDFMSLEEQDVNLYAIWGTLDPDSYRWTANYNSEGGWWYASRLMSGSEGLYMKISWTSIPHTHWPAPSRFGYRFTGWKNANNTETNIKPGTGPLFLDNFGPSKNIAWADSNNLTWKAQWSTSLSGSTINNFATSTSFTSQTYTITNDDFNGKIFIYPIATASYDRIFRLNFKGVGSRTFTNVGMLQIIDSTGKNVTITDGTNYSSRFLRFLFGGDSDTSEGANVEYSQNFLIKANTSYQIEFMCEKATLIDYKLVVSQKIATNNETISPNGGKFRIGSGASFYTSDATVTFQSNRDWVGIASKVEAGLTSFNGDPVVSSQKGFPGKPQDNSRPGYWFENWIGTTDCIPIYSQTKSQVTAWATPVPKKDFSMSAIWSPNRCFIKYHGNGATAQHTPNSEHQYNITSKVSNNSYEKFVNITYDSRGGSYETAYWNNPQQNVIFIDKDDDEIRKVRLNHTFDTWNTNSSGTGVDTEPNSNFTFTNTTYGNQHNLYAIWTINSTVLPKVSRPGFEFMGWYTDPDGGTYVGGLDTKPNCNYSATDTLNLYAHWNPLGLVEIYTDKGWKPAIPYVYTYNNVSKTYEWQRALTYIHNGSSWVLGTDTGQNMTNQQLENL